VATTATTSPSRAPSSEPGPISPARLAQFTKWREGAKSLGWSEIKLLGHLTKWYLEPSGRAAGSSVLGGFALLTPEQVDIALTEIEYRSEIAEQLAHYEDKAVALRVANLYAGANCRSLGAALDEIKGPERIFKLRQDMVDCEDYADLLKGE
jgi:hypothetical protein